MSPLVCIGDAIVMEVKVCTTSVKKLLKDIGMTMQKVQEQESVYAGKKQ